VAAAAAVRALARHHGVDMPTATHRGVLRRPRPRDAVAAVREARATLGTALGIAGWRRQLSSRRRLRRHGWAVAESVCRQAS
jgi:hypothetical protein